MTLQSSGPISLGDIQAEFGGSNPISLSEYYGVAEGVPAQGAIGLADFYGTTKGHRYWRVRGYHTSFSSGYAYEIELMLKNNGKTTAQADPLSIIKNIIGVSTEGNTAGDLSSVTDGILNTAGSFNAGSNSWFMAEFDLGVGVERWANFVRLATNANTNIDIDKVTVAYSDDNSTWTTSAELPLGVSAVTGQFTANNYVSIGL